MSQPSNESLFRRIIQEGFNDGDLAVIDELMSPDLVEHQPGMGPDPAGVKRAIAYLHEVFPDFTLQLEDVVVDGDRVWGRARARGTQDGPYMGKPSDGGSFDITVFDVCRFEDGLMVEHWGVPDRFSILQQLGMLPGA